MLSQRIGALRLLPLRATELVVESLEERLVPALGSPFSVSASDLFDQTPVTAVSASGLQVVVWVQEDPDDLFSNDLHARLYDADGNPQGGALTIADDADDEFQPDVAIDPQGNFVVAWTRNRDNADDNLDVFFALFSNSGQPRAAGPVAASADDESAPQVGVADDGSFVVACQRDTAAGADVLAQRFSAAGAPLGTLLPIAARPNRHEAAPALDVAASGRFAVSYLKADPASPTTDRLLVAVYGRKGTLLQRARLAALAGDATPRHDVGLTNQGAAVVVYDSGLASGNSDLFVRRLSRSAALSVVTALVASDAFEAAPRLAVHRDSGDFVVAYRRTASDGEHAHVGTFVKSGQPRAADVDLGADTVNAAVSVDGLDGYFVAWQSAFSLTDHDVLAAFGTAT